MLATHLLKQAYQPQRSGKSWKSSIAVQRVEIERLLADNPSLKPKAEGAFLEAYADARAVAAEETELPPKTFPTRPPFSRDQAMSAAFSPGPAVAPPQGKGRGRGIV